MLKISIIESPRQFRMVLEGKLIAPWTSELRSECAKILQELQGRELVVDMNDLLTISQEGESVLLALMNEGVKFRGNGLFTKHVVKQLTRRRARKSRMRSRDLR